MILVEAIRSNKLLADFSEDRIILLAELRGINPRSVADESSLQNLELITADLYSEVLTMPKLKEGQLSIEYDKAELRNFIETVANKYSDETLLTSIGGGDDKIEDFTDEW